MTGFAPYDPDASRMDVPILAVVREATPDDLDPLTAFELTTVSRTRGDWEAVIEQSLADDDRLFLVAEVAGDVAAFGQAHFLPMHPVNHSPPGFYLTGVTVQPSYRRGGLGRQLTVARLDWIRERADAAWYFASSANQPSIDLHSAFGFVEVSRARTIHGVTFDAGEGVLFRAEL
ncbi:MAG: GNAT family N-acetyltransferase [Actinomycetota bacterium]|nr:GNAT family N-acetyltransferase [Actinomycetota bacterium]